LKEKWKHNQDPSKISEGLLKEIKEDENQQIKQESNQLFEFQVNKHIEDVKQAEEEKFDLIVEPKRNQDENNESSEDGATPASNLIEEQVSNPNLDTSTEIFEKLKTNEDDKKEKYAQEQNNHKEISEVTKIDELNEAKSENLESADEVIEHKDINRYQDSENIKDEHKEEHKENKLNDDSEKMNNRRETENDTNFNSIKISEESSKNGSFSYYNELNHDSHKKFDEIWDKYNNEAKLNNKELITQIKEFLNSSILSKIYLKMTQIEESLKPEINKNNEKIDNSATILNKNNEILNDNSKSLSSFCSSIETIKNLISELPQKTTIGDEFLSVNYFLTVSLLA